MTKQIKLTRGMVAIVDDDVYEWAKEYNWQVKIDDTRCYARRTLGNKKQVYLHQEIMQSPSNMVIDHIDGDGLNCVRDNMRIVTHAENMRNSRIRNDSSSNFKGVCYRKNRNTWQASIQFENRRIHLGTFDTATEAAAAYDRAALKYHGEFAKINWPDPAPYEVNE